METKLPRVLVIDDDASMRNLLTEALVLEGFAAKAASPEQAFAYLKDHFDLVITDIVMPSIDGIEIIQHIHENYPNVRVIAMSGGGANGDPNPYLDAAEILGADCVLSKPFEVSLLVDTATNLLPSDKPSPNL